MMRLLAVALLSMSAARGSAQTTSEARSASAAEGPVVDIGGAFISANDPKALAKWYGDVFGVELALNEEDGSYYFVFRHGQAAGSGPVTVFAIKPAEGTLSAPKNQFMVNFQIRDFDGFVESLKSKKVVIDKTKDYPHFGRFGWIKDSEDNVVEFWQPTK